MEGQNGDAVIRGRGMCEIFCFNWIDFDHLTEITTPDELR